MREVYFFFLRDVNFRDTRLFQMTQSIKWQYLVVTRINYNSSTGWQSANRCGFRKFRDRIESQELLWGPSFGIVPIIERDSARFSSHSCNYDIFVGWCPCTLWATCIYKYRRSE